MSIKEELRRLISRYVKEERVEVSDWILTEFLYNSLMSFEQAINRRGMCNNEISLKEGSEGKETV